MPAVNHDVYKRYGAIARRSYNVCTESDKFNAVFDGQQARKEKGWEGCWMLEMPGAMGSHPRS